jgi:hypothetical protein
MPQQTTMTGEDLEREFESRDTRRGGTLILPAPDALALIQRARREHVPVLGLDAFRLTPSTTQPDLANSIDFSGASCRTNPWAEAEAFLEERLASGLEFEVILA